MSDYYRRSLCALARLAVAEVVRLRGGVTVDHAGRPKSGDFGYAKRLRPFALILLAALAGCGRGVDPSVVDPYEVLHEKLQQIVTVDWDNVPLETALRELGQQRGLSVAFDQDAL